jgi:hypothetical protein
VTAAWELALHYFGLRHPNADVFRRLHQRLRETRNVTCTALVNAGGPRTLRTPADEDAIIAGVEGEPCINSHYIAQELGLCQTRVFEVILGDEARVHLFPKYSFLHLLYL